MHIARRSAMLTASFLVITLGACATNPLRVEQAGEVANSGAAVATASRAYLDEAERQQYAFYTELVVGDPVCGRSGARARSNAGEAQLNASGQAAAGGWLCTLSPPPTGGSELNLAPITEELEPTLQLISSLEDYSRAITKILGRSKSDPGKDIENALTSARAACGFIAALRGGSGCPTTVVPGSDDPRLGALIPFIGFLNELREEARSVQMLTRLEAEFRGPDGGSAAKLIDALSTHLRLWANNRRTTDNANLQLSRLYLDAAVAERSQANADARRRIASSYYERHRAEAKAREADRALRNAVAELGDIHRQYRDLLRNPPILTPELRARRAEILRQRITRALELATAVITSLKGA